MQEAPVRVERQVQGYVIRAASQFRGTFTYERSRSVNGNAAEQTQRTLNIGTQNFDSSIDSGFSGGGETIGISASTKYGTSAKTEGFNNVSATANAAIHEDFGLPVNRIYDFGQSAQRRWNTIQLTSAMVGNGNRGGSFVDRAPSIVARKYALDHDGPRPNLANPCEVTPGHGRLSESDGYVDQRHRTFAGKLQRCAEGEFRHRAESL